MASFDVAYAFLLSDEGGYVHNPSDPGGETYRGITRRDYPNWDGWVAVDAQKTSPEFPKVLDSLAPLQTSVKLFYYNNFWKFDAVTSQYMANKLLSESVNTGAGTAVKILQASLQYLGNGQIGAVDGVFGPHTLAALNLSEPDKVAAEFRAQLVFHYKDIEAAKPAMAVFDKGWIRRAVK